MQSTAKKIGKSGQITIPKQFRAKAGMFPGGSVKVNVEDDGSVVLKSVVPCCNFCGSPEDVFDVNVTRICKSCAQIIVEKVRENHG